MATGADVVRTWHVETLVVATVLTAVALCSGGGSLELVGAGAVGLFLAYPVWRRWWRTRHPLGRS
jgi:hypothetical protein